MGAPFDHIATNYDAVFTNSAIGQLQRTHVWKYIEKITPELSGLDMLELTPGTGEDAALFSDGGFNIIGTDISEEMLKVTQQKVQQFSMQHRISSQYLDLETFSENSFHKKFDLIFSNFGGLNCISPESLRILLAKIPLALNKGGRFVGVFMPKLYMWETLYYLLRFSAGKAFRRLTDKQVTSHVSGVQMNAWYYSPGQIKRWSSDNFTHVISKPIGIALPPLQLESFFTKHTKWLNQLNKIENKLNSLSPLARFSDHYLIDLRLK